MKAKKFLEQLNLYLDGEIDPAAAAELEQDILSDPARRRVYNDYCRIHRATKLVCEQFRVAGAANVTNALPSARALVSADLADEPFVLGGRMGGRAAIRPFRRVAFVSGLAAACIAGVFLGSLALAPSTPETIAPAPTVAIIEPAPAAPLVAANAPADTQPASFPAPFAPEMRSDPFVQFAQVRGDPFALTPWTPVDALSGPVPASLANPPTLRVDPRFRPVGFDTGPDLEEARENRPFRLRVKAQPVSASPSEFSGQP